MKNKFLTLVILLASFSIVSCGGGSADTKETLNVEENEPDTENQSANGIWSSDESGDGDTETIGIFNDGNFVIVNVSNGESEEMPTGKSFQGNYTITGDTLETVNAEAYHLNGNFIAAVNISGVVNTQATILATAMDEGGLAGDTITLTYDILNTDRDITLDDLVGSWLPGIAEDGEITISNTGAFAMTMDGCETVGTVAITTSDNIFELELSSMGETCPATGDFDGFALVSDDHADDNDTTILNNELILIYSNDDFGFAYPAFKDTVEAP